MKFFVTVILIAVVSFVACIYLPWWSIALSSVLVILIIPQRPLTAFIAGFLAIFILWSALSFYISNQNDNILAHKISLIVLKTDSPVGLIFLTGLIGALVAGCAALTGSFLRKPDRTR